jgi:phage shock protein E
MNERIFSSMSKQSKSKTQLNSRWLILGAAIALIASLGAIFLLNPGNPASPEAQSSTTPLLTPAEYQDQFGSGTEHLLLDVRTPEEFEEEHIASAVNINVEDLEAHLDEVPRDIPVVLYCRSGNRSGQAAEILANAGYDNIYDLGSIKDWVAAGYAVE